MKNEYFGDVKDYRKFGLLRALLKAGNVKLLVAWMLTGPNPERPGDGQSRGYLDNEARYGDCDPELYFWLRGKVRDERTWKVSAIEDSDMLKGATFYSAEVPDNCSGRQQWAEGMYKRAKGADVVFLDPDIGIEPPSKPGGRGTKGSSRYVFWTEIERLWSEGKSLLIYQHFGHTEHDTFIKSKLRDLEGHLCSPKPYQLTAFETPHVVFLLALQKEMEFEVSEAWMRHRQLWR